jgi:hypothetical protein
MIKNLVTLVHMRENELASSILQQREERQSSTMSVTKKSDFLGGSIIPWYLDKEKQKKRKKPSSRDLHFTTSFGED